MKHPAKIILVAFIIYVLLFAACINRVDAKAAPLPCKQYHALLRKHHLPVKVFAPLMWRESKCQPRAIGWNYHKGQDHTDCRLSPARTYRKCRAVKSWDSGLLQINSSWRTITFQTCHTTDIFQLLQASCNVKVAAVLYNGGKGLSNWGATRSTNIRDDNP